MIALKKKDEWWERERERESCVAINEMATPGRFGFDWIKRKRANQRPAVGNPPISDGGNGSLSISSAEIEKKTQKKKTRIHRDPSIESTERSFFLFQQKKKLEEVEGGAKKRSEFRFRKKKTGNEIERNRTQKKKNWNWPVACSDRQKVDRRETNLITTLNANHQSPEARWDYERVSPVDSTKKIHSERTFWRFERPRGVFHVGSFFFIHFLVPFDYFYQRNVFSVSNNNSRVLRSSKMPYNGRLRAVIANFRIKPMDRNELSNASQM